MKFGAAILMVALLALSAFASARVVVSSLPEAVWDDTEVVTNAALPAARADSRVFAFTLELDATPPTGGAA